MNPNQQIMGLLKAFQEGYACRDLSQVDTFMELFLPDVEVVGTNGVRPGVDEWYMDRVSARELFQGDWECWGDFSLDLEFASIHAIGDVGWVAATAAVTQTIGDENYAAYLEYIRTYIEEPGISAEQKLHYILRGGMNTVYELRRGEKFTWPLRFTAVVVHQADGWKFAQLNFSFPTIYFPDVRILEENNLSN